MEQSVEVNLLFGHDTSPKLILGTWYLAFTYARNMSDCRCRYGPRNSASTMADGYCWY